MKKTVSAIIGLTMTLAMAGVSLAAQGTPAPAAKAESTTGATKSTRKAVAKKHVKSTAKTASKTAATPAK